MAGVSAAEFKLVFTGPMGAGKTTAIAAISEIPPVRTEVANTDRSGHDKASTTVGLDFGRLTLTDGSIVRLYGTPGQARYRFMWNVLAKGAAGVIILLDASQAGALVHLDQFIEAFLPDMDQLALVVGVGRAEQPGALPSEAFASRLESRGHSLPVLSVDVRRREDVLLLVEALACTLAARSGETA